MKYKKVFDKTPNETKLNNNWTLLHFSISLPLFQFSFADQIHRLPEWWIAQIYHYFLSDAEIFKCMYVCTFALSQNKYSIKLKSNLLLISSNPFTSISIQNKMKSFVLWYSNIFGHPLWIYLKQYEFNLQNKVYFEVINQLRINMRFSAKERIKTEKVFLEKGRDAIFLQVMLESNQLQSS